MSPADLSTLGFVLVTAASAGGFATVVRAMLQEAPDAEPQNEREPYGEEALAIREVPDIAARWS